MRSMWHKVKESIVDSFPRILKVKIKIKTSFVITERPKGRVIKIDIDFMIFMLIFVENCLEPVLIQRILICFKAILENIFNILLGEPSSPLQRDWLGMKKTLNHYSYFIIY